MMVNGRMMAAPAGAPLHTSEQTSASQTSSLSLLSPLLPARRRLRERNPLCPHQRKSLPATQRRSLNWQHSSRTVSLCSIRMKRSACPNPIRSRRPWPISLNGQSSMPSRAIEFMSSRMPLGTLPTAASFRWTRCSLTLNARSVYNGSLIKNIKARICSKALRALSFQRRRRLLLQKVNLREPRDSILEHAIIPLRKVEPDVAMNRFAEEARTRHRAELHFSAKSRQN